MHQSAMLIADALVLFADRAAARLPQILRVAFGVAVGLAFAGDFRGNDVGVIGAVCDAMRHVEFVVFECGGQIGLAATAIGKLPSGFAASVGAEAIAHPHLAL